MVTLHFWSYFHEQRGFIDILPFDKLSSKEPICSLLKNHKILHEYNKRMNIKRVWKMRLRNAKILVISFLILMYKMYLSCLYGYDDIFLCKDSKLIQHTFNHIIGYHILTIIYDDHQKDHEIKYKTLSDETKWQPTNTI